MTGRRLLNILEGELFLTDVLGLELNPKLETALGKLIGLELQLLKFDWKRDNTLVSDSFRMSQFRNNAHRLKLRKQIADELFNLPLLASDDAICLGNGGAAPLQCGKGNCFIVIGLPASGKSYICHGIAKQENAYIVDSDFAKRKLPEYLNQDFGASLVHEESDEVTMRAHYSLIARCLAENYNMVIPKIGHNYAAIAVFAESIKRLGYQVNLTLVQLDRKQATINALKRFLETGRYVPLTLIYDHYANDPTITYYQAKENLKDKLFSNFNILPGYQQP